MRESTVQVENPEVEEVLEDPGASHAFTDMALMKVKVSVLWRRPQ
jgi:hypothetical protein